MLKTGKPLILIIIDGVGIAPPGKGNAVTQARTPNLNKLWTNYPHTTLFASGLSVGLPQGVDGNSEVGHLNIGAGKIVLQELPRIDLAVQSKAFENNQYFLKAFENTKNGGDLHIMGLLGSGQVHSSYGHMVALMQAINKNKLDKYKVYYHVFTDGRDSPPQSSVSLLKKMNEDLKRYNAGRIASVCGRYYAMDRDLRWERTKLAYDMITKGVGNKTSDFEFSINESYKKNVTDEYLQPIVLYENEHPLATIKPGDSVIFSNFRADRAQQLTRVFEQTDFDGFQRDMIQNLYFVGMSDYENGYPKNAAFPPEQISNPLGKIISDNGLKQLRIAESEKFPHVTYFFNGGNNNIYPGEERVEVPSPKDVATYDLKPEMSAIPMTEKVISAIKSNKYDFIVLNFANADMVAHTGNIEKTVIGMETIDESLMKIYDVVIPSGGTIIITADHGNAEEMLDFQNGKVDTKHSTNPVPLIIINRELSVKELAIGTLADIAPTVLSMFGIPKPNEMNGKNLLE